MCGTRSRSKSRKTHHHSCSYRIFKCSPKQLCTYCFLLYCITTGNYCNASRIPKHEDMMSIDDNNIPQTKPEVHEIQSSELIDNAFDVINTNETVQCNKDDCYLTIASSKEALEEMSSVSYHLYTAYATQHGSKTVMDEEDLETLLNDLRGKDSHAGHDHEHGDHGDRHEGHHQDSHEGHDHEHGDHGDGHEGHDHDNHEESSGDMRTADSPGGGVIKYHTPDIMATGPADDEMERLVKRSIPCYSSVKELAKAYLKPYDIHLTFTDFMTLLPQIVFDMIRPECKESEHDHDHEHESDNEKEKTGIAHNTVNVWLISFGTVIVISLVSLLGVLTIPLMKHSTILNNVIAFLVAMAVGTLTGDALLHLLPRATGSHDHSSGGHDHGEEEEDNFDSMWKGLIACFGIYFFYFLESIMSFIHKRKKSSKEHKHCHSTREEQACGSTTTVSTRIVMTGLQEKENGTSSGSPLLGTTSFSHPKEQPSFTPLVSDGKDCSHGEHDGKRDGHRVIVELDELPLETGHNHHHAHEVPQSIGSLAWMVIVGDGLHNITDGLAIGAAFTSSIGTGLGTVLAIFFHEIPQELADFAVLLNAGMTVKQALFWNFLSACLCFVGLLIGLLVGEYTNGIITWVLAFTAGGFLYIALADMIPALMKQLTDRNFLCRFIIHNVGMFSGFALMVIIALKEESFGDLF